MEQSMSSLHTNGSEIMPNSLWGVFGPFDGNDDCDPPEPGKKWLTIATIEDTKDGPIMGDEMAIIVVRDPFKIEQEHWDRADAIAGAHNMRHHDWAEALELLQQAARMKKDDLVSNQN